MQAKPSRCQFTVGTAAVLSGGLVGGLVGSRLAQGELDVVLVEDKAELLVAFNHSAKPERPFMYHCHILEHEDAGMMGQYVCA